MAYINKSDPTVLKKLREQVYGVKQDDDTHEKTKETEIKSNSTTKSDPTVLQRLREQVAKKNSEDGAPRNAGGAAYKSVVSLLNTPATNSSSFTDTTRNSLTTFNNKRNGKTTIESEMTEEERKARIDEIDSELYKLKESRVGLERARLYGGVGDMITQNESRQAELNAERERLQAEAKKEADAIKAEHEVRAKEYEARVKEIDEQLKVKSARFRELNDIIDAHRGERELDSVYNSSVSEQNYVDHEIQALKKLKKAYEKAIKNGGVVNEDVFLGQFKSNYTVSDINRNMGKVANDYIDNAVALGTDVYEDYDTEGNPEMQRAIEIQTKLRQESNEAQSQINKESAEIYNNLSKVFQMNNAEALDEEGRVLPWISKSVAGYLPQFVDQAKAQAEGGAYGFLLGNAIGQGGRGASVGAGIASGMQEYEVMRGTVYMTLIENGVDEETAIAAASDEALISGLIEGGSTMVGWMLSGTGNAWKAITDVALKNVAKGTAGAASKTIAGMAIKGTAKSVSKPLWRKAAGTGLRVLGNAATEMGEEWLQQGVSIANEERAKRGETGKTNLVGNTYNTIKEVVSGENPKASAEMWDAAKEGGIIGGLFGGSTTIVNNVITYYATAETREQQNDVADFIRQDEETLDALIEEGKASGKGSVSEKIAKEVEKAKEKGNVTRDQVKRLIASNETYIKYEEMQTEGERVSVDRRQAGTPLAERLEAMSESNEPLDIEDVKKVTSFGENGARLVAELAGNEGVTFSQATKTVETAYQAGYTNLDAKQASFETETQINAFTAGKQDRLLKDTANREAAKKASVYDTGFTENEYSAKLTDGQREVISVLAKDLKMDVEVVDKVVAAVVNGIEYEANAYHQDGTMRISSTTENPIVGTAVHEGFHRVKQLAPDEFKTLANFIYNSMPGEKRSEKYDLTKAEHDEAGIEMDSDDIIEEMAVRSIEEILNSPEKFLEFRESLEANSKAKSAWQKVWEAIIKVLQDIKAAITRSKLSPDTKKQALAEADRLDALMRDAYKAAMTAADKRMSEVSQNTETRQENEGKTQKNTDSKGGVNFSIKEGYAKEIDAWKKSGMPDGEMFVLGMTGDVLQGLGAIESDIYMLGDKIKEILKEHPEMSIDEIKKIPQILENPVLILKSKNDVKNNSRLIIFGSVKAQDGRPILSVLDLRPVENNLVVADMQKVTSAYTKDMNPVSFIEKSLVVYADKKITTKLLRTIGFKMPIELQQSGYIGSISYVEQNVNIFGKSFSDVFRTGDENRDSFKDEATVSIEEGLNGSKNYSLKVTDKKTIAFLENQEHITTYKAMQVIDGKLYPPMAAKTKGEDGKYHLTNPSELGSWQQAVEDTANIKFNDKGVGYYVLNKGDGTSVTAAYNPYEHSSNLVLNDQFEAAYTRDNLVTVECVIPKSEMTSGYKAQYAKDSTGVLDWKSGVVAGKIKDNKRMVYLSRWLKPVRILSDAETASMYKDALGDSGVSVPFNVVTPSLLSELEKIGVPIDYEGSPMYKSIQERKNEEAGKTTQSSKSNSKAKKSHSLSSEEKKAVNALGEGAKAVTDKNGDLLIATNKDKNTIMYSIKTHKNGGKAALEKALRANGHTEAEIRETLSFVDDAADYLTILAAGFAKNQGYNALSDHLVADVITNVKTGKQVISAIVNNGDYPVNIDLALICKKRVAYMNLMNRLIDDGIFDKVNYGGEAIAKVNEMLRTDGFETACLGCFVESRRLQFQAWAETIVSEWNAEVDKRKKNAGSFNFTEGNAALTDAEMDALAEELKNAGKKNPQGNLNLGQGSVQTRMGRLLDKVPSLQKHLTVADLLKPEGLTALRAYDSNLFSLVKSRYGAASPKIVQDYNPYASEIAMLTFASVKNITTNAVKGADAYRQKAINEMGGRPVKQKGESKDAFKARREEFNAKVEDEAIRKYLYDIGGARIQSFSDFMIENVFDYIQIFADLSAKRLPLHGYTKEIVALRLFGMTGAKWNGSLIAHVDRNMGKEYAGLLPASEAKNGNAILVHTKDGDFAIGFDDYARHKATKGESFVQSIGMKDIIALQLDPRYSSYVGSITIGVSDKQILAMLDSPLFRYVIPYHSSGMLPQFAKLVGVDLYNDYTDYQNTTVKQWYDAYGTPCEPIRNAKNEVIDVDTSYAFNAEVQKTGDAKKAADNYLKWCGEKHPVYDKDGNRIGYVTFNPKFSDSPYGTDFTKHENYYKMLEDFDCYDNITGESAVQGAVTMTFPSEENRMSASEKEAYKARLRETGIFSEKDIEKYSAIADKTFKDLIAEEVKGRAEYQKAQAPKWDNTVDKIENMLLTEHKRSHSLKKTDTEYLELAKNPKKNEARLREMVAEAAKKAGYNSPDLYHGTDHFGFTSVDTGVNRGDGISFWASNKADTAGTYTSVSRVRGVNEQYDYNIVEEVIEEIDSEIDDAVEDFCYKIKKHLSEWVFGYDGGNSYVRGIVEKYFGTTIDSLFDGGLYEELTDIVANAYYDYGEQYHEEYAEYAEWENSKEYEEIGEAIVTLEGLIIKRNEVDDKYETSGVYHLYGNTENFFEIDGKGANWNNIRSEMLPERKYNWAYTTRDVVKWASENGYDGVIFRNITDNGGKGYAGLNDVYAFFKPQKQVKSADTVTYDDDGNIIPLSERFNSEKTDIRYSLKSPSKKGKAEYAPTFYSHMSKTIDGMKDGKIGANSVVSYLKGKGVKNEEIKWSGIEEFLEGKKSVTKAELQEFVAGNQLQIETIAHKSGNAVLRSDGYSKDFEVSTGAEYQDYLLWDEGKNIWVSKETGKKFSSVDKIKKAYKINGSGTYFDYYTLENGSNYRELLFKLPNSEYTNRAMNMHWGEDNKGILAHARIQDFDVDGKKMLFIEEIQSDWHNEGHKDGNHYISEGQKTYQDVRNETGDSFRRFMDDDISQALLARIEKNVGYDKALDIMSEVFEGDQYAYADLVSMSGGLTQDEKEFISNAINEETEIKKQYESAVPDGNYVPDAPYRDNYHEFVLKNLIRMAAEEGYDSIGWTTADIQSERWSDDFAEGYRIEYDQDIPKFLSKYGKKWGAEVGKTTLRNGNEVWTFNITDEMKQSVLYEGQAQYSLKGGLSGREINDARLSKYVDKDATSTEEYGKLVDRYGAIPKGEKPFRNVQVPKKTDDDEKVSQTVRTILEAKATPEEAVPTVEKMVEDGVFSYNVYTDKQAISDAESYIKEYGWDESLEDWFADMENGVVSKQHTAMGWALYNNAANLAATTTSETEKATAIKTSLEILDAMVKHQRNAAQAVQATRILKKLSPETQLYGIQKSVSALQKELADKYGKKAPDLKINESLAEQFLKAETDEERTAAEKEIYKDIGRQMPSRFIDKWNAWRYLAMLGNVRTHGRNIVGNAGFAPVVLTKDLLATGIEAAVYGVSGKKTVRGKSLIVGNKKDRALLSAAWKDYGNVADLVSNGGKYSDFAVSNQYIEEGRRIFKTKPLEWARKGNSKALEAEDVWFSKPHYAYAMAQYCKANNITPEQIARGVAIEPARAYAIKEAQKATYKDTNAFSQMVSGWGRSNKDDNIVVKAANTVIEGILPFRKTPANILVRGVEYSPIGLLKGLSYDLVQVRKGKMTASEAIDNISAGLTGTGLVGLGVWLAAEGLVRGHGEDEEEEKEFKELMGHQSYALELPNGTSITLDWLAPEALPFFVGVNLWETAQGKKGKLNFSSILKAISTVSEPMLEMSCLQSLNDVFESVGYAASNDTSGLVSVLSSAATSYLTQGIPTLSGQAERTGEANRMTTYTEKNAFLTGDMQYTLGKASAKIPGWDFNQIPYIDAWGRKEASGTALKRGFNNFLNPAYTSKIENGDVEKELLRLYEETGEGSVFPSRAAKYFTVDGKRKDLTADEYVRYATLKGEKSYKAVTDLIKSKAYQQLDDADKVKAIENAYDLANQKAKQAVSKYAPQKWVDYADEFGSNSSNYLSFRTEVSSTKQANGDKISKSDVADIIEDTAQNDDEAWLMYLSMYDGKGDYEAMDNGVKAMDYMEYQAGLEKAKSDGSLTKEEAVDVLAGMDISDSDAWAMYLSDYDSPTAQEAKKHGIDATLYMTATVDMSGIKADYDKNGKAISGSRRQKIERYLNSVCSSYKEYLFLLGTEYSSVKDDHDYIAYFGK